MAPLERTVEVYTLYRRPAMWVRRLMCGSGKSSLRHLAREDIATLTREASGISGIPMLTEMDGDAAWEIIMQ